MEKNGAYSKITFLMLVRSLFRLPQKKTLDDFPVGIYDLKATHKVDNKKFDGVIHIDMSESNSADLQFKQKRFTVSIDSTYADSDSLKLYINGYEQSDFDEYESVTY